MKNVLTLAVLLFLGNLAMAQNHNTLWCDKDIKLKNTHNLKQQKTTEAGKLNFQANWGAPNGGSTLLSTHVKITNGVCESCTPLGALGSGNYQQNWVIKVTDRSKPVEIQWATPGTINLCGTGKLRILKP